MPDEERRIIIKALLDGTIIKYQTKQMLGNPSSQASAAGWQLNEESHSHPGSRTEWPFLSNEEGQHSDQSVSECRH